MQIYTGEEHKDVVEIVERHAADNRRSFSWAGRDLIRLGASVVKVPRVAGGIEGWRAMVDREKGGGDAEH